MTQAATRLTCTGPGQAHQKWLRRWSPTLRNQVVPNPGNRLVLNRGNSARFGVHRLISSSIAMLMDTSSHDIT